MTHAELYDMIEPLCVELDLNPNNVKQLVLTPTEITATIYRLNDHGAKYVDANGKVPTDELTFIVTLDA